MLSLMYESSNGVTQDYREVGSVVGKNCDTIIVLGGVSFSEEFASQTNTPFDHVHFLRAKMHRLMPILFCCYLFLMLYSFFVRIQV